MPTLVEPRIADPKHCVSPHCETFARLLHRGSELLRDGDPREAKECAEKALRLLSDNVSARNLLALASFQCGDLEHALVQYESLLLDRPKSGAAKVNMAVVLLKLGRASLARPLLEEVVRVSPDRFRAWGYLGVALEQLGLIAEAERAFLTGHHANAAKRLRERHAPPASIPEVPAANARADAPPFREGTLLPGDWSDRTRAAGGTVAHASPQRFVVTLRPPDLVRAGTSATHRAARSAGEPTTPVPAADEAHEIPFEQTISPPIALLPPSMSSAPKQNRPVVPLLDAALSSLLVVPHEATVVVHPTGLVLVGLVQREGARDGGFAVRSDTVHALAGPLRCEPLGARPAPAPEPFRDAPSPFMRVSGTGQLMLAPLRGTRLLPVQMDADVAFLREDLVVAFNHSLLYDLGRMRSASGESLALVRFRGDGVIVLGLDRSFLAFDVRGDQTITLRATSLIGWIGLLAPDPVLDPMTTAPADQLLSFSGEGTVLFRAPENE